ncbi:centromere-associated protein E isoform X2 [Anarrhichthys ocellatus]|uniref:centromere-associated protein E isoform X2 n=1 Tax=Anarrhichthys ocellatus TaxID=433405 RepID=UPI0012EE695C|nr:centromere-associated protein E isoform X2 [Anarrhichthys ocellatus]
MTEESAVKVCVRVRPLIEREESAASENAESVQVFWKADKKSIHQIDDGNSTKSFVFDRVFIAEETTNQLYQSIAKPLVVSSVQGYNGTIFAYGQTASGKTFTMMGSNRIHGVIPLAVEDVFHTIKNCSKKEFLLRVSYMEIYNETVSDLLVDSWKRKPLEVREGINKNIYVADLTEELVTNPGQALAWIRKGEKNRHYGKTKMNERSSRSHTIFRMILESRESDSASGENADGAIIVSHLNLVDLAGSERASQTGAEGTRFKEGCNINRSLFTLGQVIKKLTDESQKGFTSYRDSKLTRILQNSLGGNAKTVIICTITPVALDETLSTLQFASTAKKMKNDPHVTEVSDDGALLKRYRNEIVDLKRRLHEVSSDTQTTATEKKVLSQLLQEKDQLQREQEDRIRNLTKLLVTSSNLVPVRKRPKRRVTWGGKMLRLAPPSACDEGPSDLSFAESFTHQRKAGRSCLTDLCEEDEDFDSHWEIPDEPSDDMDMSQSSVTVRSFGDSPKDFSSPDRIHKLSGKVSHLELQLEMESQHKEEAMSKVDALDGRVAELELQLQTEAHQKQEALEKMQTAELRAAEVELQLQLQTENQQQQEALEEMQTAEPKMAELLLQLQTEVQQRREANEKAEMLEFRVADLERRLEEQSHTRSETDEQMRKEFAETIQLCETLAKEKDMVAAERNYLKQELGMFIEQTERLEKEKAALLTEMEEKREMDEFKSLEEEFSKEHENELQNEISELKRTVESSELQCLELQNKLETLSEKLQKKTVFAEELQSMSGKDLVQEVATLRRSLDDAEGLSRDTKKEWAHLRSKNIAVEEMNVTLSASSSKMEAEVNSLRFQLEKEKSRFRAMQSDLEKELNVAFNENTKLTSLLDGKVPKNLIDSMELERTVAQLNRELTASHEAEGALRAQLEELASLQTLPEKVDHLTKQLNELTEELQRVREEQDALLSEQRSSAEETEKLLSTVTALTAERDQLTRDLQENEEMAAETQLLLQSLQDELQEQRGKNSDLVNLAEQKESESREHLLSLSQELQRVREEQDALLSEQRSSAEETEKLLSTVTALTAERDQLQTDMRENVEMMIENQEALRTALEKNRQRKEQIKQLETKREDSPDEMRARMEELKTLMIENQEELRASQEKVRILQDEINELRSQKAELEGRSRDGSDAEIYLQLQELQNQIQRLTEELESVRAERDGLSSERTADAQTRSEETEELLCRVMSLSEERDQLQETLEALRREKKQLRAELENRMETVALAQSGFNQPDMVTSELQPQDENVTHLQQEIKELQATFQAVTEQKSQLEVDLQRETETATETRDLLHSLQQQLQEQNQRNVDLETRSPERPAQLEQQVAETLCHIQSLQEELQEQKQLYSDHMTLCEQKESDLDQQTKTLTEQLESARAERDALSEKETSGQTSTEEMEELLCRVTSLSEERDQLLETLEALRQEKKQLRAELEDRMETMQCELQLQQLSSEPQSLKDEQDDCSALQIQQLEERLEKTQEEVSQLKSDLQENVELMIENQEELRASQEKVRILQDEINELRSQKAELEGRSRDGSDAEIYLQLQELQNQIQRLTEELESVRAERDGLSSERDGLSSERTADAQTHSEETEELLCRVTSLSEERDQLQETLEALRREKKQLRAELEDRMETMQTEMRTLTEKLELVEVERDGLLSEKEASGQTSTEEKEDLLLRVTSLSEERDQLQETLEALRQEKKQLRAELEDRMETMQTEIAQLNTSLQTVTEQKRRLEDDLQQSMDTASTTEELVKSLQEKLCEQKQMNSYLDKLFQEKERSLDQQMRTLTEKLQSIEAERDGLLSEKETSGQTSTEEKEDLLLRVTSLSEERDQLQETLEALRREKEQLRAELEDRMETLLGEANTTISALREQLSSLDQSTSGVKEEEEEAASASRLQDSAEQLQESFGRFQTFIDDCSKYSSTAPDKMLCSLSHLSTLPKPTTDAYSTVCQLQLQTARTLGNIPEHLQVRAQDYRNLFKLLVKKDLAVFEERRRQDLLLCRAQAPRRSLKDEDGRLTELLDKRQLCLQKMSSVYGKLRANMASYTSELLAEMRARERFTGQLKAVFTGQSFSFSGLDGILSGELDHRSAMEQDRKMTLQAIMEEQNGLCEELKLLESQADSRLQEERSKTSTLLEGAPLKKELTLLKDNQQLVLQLQQAEERVKALCAHIEQLEEAQVKASNRLSNHKQATQLLQTELQDSRAQVDEKDGTIQTLKSKLRQSEKNASPSAVELEKLRSKLFKMEVELSSASDNHKQEIQMMSTVLKEKEESVRKLKESLRKSQQEGEESFLQGEDLHARLTNPRGLVIKTSILLEKNKLEQEVNQLQLKITELESLVSSQQEEITKWKSRATRLKGKTKAEVDKPSSPCTPTKRGLSMTSDTSNFFSSPKKFLATPRKLLDSPRKLLDSPKVSLLDSPKSRFWGAGGSSEMLSRTLPKQFFNNSKLGTIPDVDADADGKEDRWPQSPNQEQMCKTQ